MRPLRLALTFAALAPLLGASECTGATCEPSDGQVAFEIANEDLANDYGIDDPNAIDADTCVVICEDSSGLTDVTSCESEAKGDGTTTIACEGTFDC